MGARIGVNSGRWCQAAAAAMMMMLIGGAAMALFAIIGLAVSFGGVTMLRS